jgi:hypothetical protein
MTSEEVESSWPSSPASSRPDGVDDASSSESNSEIPSLGISAASGKGVAFSIDNILGRTNESQGDATKDCGERSANTVGNLIGEFWLIKCYWFNIEFKLYRYNIQTTSVDKIDTQNKIY